MSPCQGIRTRSGKCYPPSRGGTAETKRAKQAKPAKSKPAKAKPAKAMPAKRAKPKPTKAKCFDPIMMDDESEADLFLELDGGEGDRETICLNKEGWTSYKNLATKMYRCKESKRREGIWLPDTDSDSKLLYKVGFREAILLSEKTMGRITKAVEAGSKGRARQARLVLKRIDKLVRVSNAGVNDKHENSQGAAMCGITGQFDEYE